MVLIPAPVHPALFGLTAGGGGGGSISAGQSACASCAKCDINAVMSSPGCPAGSQTDGVKCTCNAGFYGNGFNCTACKKCAGDATLAGNCLGGLVDGISCCCNAGYYGNGLQCTICPELTYATAPCQSPSAESDLGRSGGDVQERGEGPLVGTQLFSSLSGSNWRWNVIMRREPHSGVQLTNDV